MIEINSEIDNERNRNVQSKGIEASYLSLRGSWFDGVVNRKGSPFPIPFPGDWRGLVRGVGPGGWSRGAVQGGGTPAPEKQNRFFSRLEICSKDINVKKRLF